jgi:glycosyltransferase involved in cell wall biosynthesis
LNILFLSELFYPHGSGGELATFLYADYLSKEEFNISVITNQFPGEEAVSKRRHLSIYRLPLFKGTNSVRYSLLKRLDVLYSGFMRRMMEWAQVVYIPRFWYSAILLAKFYRKPVITQLHTYIPICPLSTNYDMSKRAICENDGLICPPKCIYIYERTQNRSSFETIMSVLLNSTTVSSLRLLKFSDAIICVSKVQRDIISRKAPFLSTKINIVNNPYPELPYLEIKGDEFGYFGGPSPLKGFQVLCRALEYINDDSIRVHSTNFPKGYVNSTNRQEMYIYERINLEKIYGQIRAVIVPSIGAETWSYVSTEAILRGRLLVASRIGGIPEQVEGGKGAFLFQPGNAKELAELIQFVKGLDRETVVDFGLHNRQTFIKKYDNKRTIRSFINILNRVTE